MKRRIFVIICIFMATVAFANNKIVENFRATVGNNSEVNIEWNTKSEVNISQFEIERSTSASPIFRTIRTEPARGRPSTYRFTDTDNFTKSSLEDELQSAATVTYRIKIVYSNSQFAYSEEVVVYRNVNSIRRTLGMIKEMFR